MRVLKLFLVIFIFTIAINAQDMISGYYVADSPSLTEESRQLLENKIAEALSEAGVTSTDQYYPVVTVVKYDEIETIENTGIRTIYKTVGKVSLLLMLEKTKKLISAKSFKVEGSGTSKEVAQNNAIENIEVSSADLKELFSKNKAAIKNEMSKNKSTTKKTTKGTSSTTTKTDDKTKLASGKKVETEKTEPTQSSGDLTSTMKQSRNEVNKSYQALFNKLFKK